MARRFGLGRARRREGNALCASCSNTAMCLKFPSESLCLGSCTHDPNGYVSDSILIRLEETLARRTGSADLPLHGGRVPAWLGQRMSVLGAVIVEAITHHYGRDEVLRRLSHPFWFQSFGAVMGMDWHSSGITTSVIGALKRGLAPLGGELGIHVCGGRGRHSRRTPDELNALGDRIGFDAVALTRASRLVAKVDSAAVQDGFDLYLHGLFVTDEGKWTAVQQGMNEDTRQARRYHWHSGDVTDFVDAPHSAIQGPCQGDIFNLTDKRAAASRSAQLDLLAILGPGRIVGELAAIFASAPSQMTLPYLIMPAHHDVRSSDGFTRRLHGTLAAPAIFPNCCLRPASAREPCSPWPWWRRSSMARLTASRTWRDFPWRMATRTGIPTRCRSATRPSGF